MLHHKSHAEKNFFHPQLFLSLLYSIHPTLAHKLGNARMDSVMAKLSLSLSKITSAMECCEPPRHGSPRSVVVVAHDDQDNVDAEEPLLRKGSTSTAARRILGATAGVHNRTLRVGLSTPDQSHCRSSLQSSTAVSQTSSATTTLGAISVTPNVAPPAVTNGQCASMPVRCNSSSSSHRRQSFTALSRTNDTAPSPQHVVSSSLPLAPVQRRGTASNTRTPRVRFLSRVTYCPTDSLQPPTRDECMAAWYTARDYNMFRRALRNEILHAREAVVYNDYRHCFETVWHACHGRSSSCSSRCTLKPNDNDEEMATLWDWRDRGDGGNAAGSLARPLAASRFCGLERAIFAQLVQTASHRAAATHAVVQAYQESLNESYPQRAQRVRLVAMHYSLPHQRLARVYAYGQAQLEASSWQFSRETTTTALAQQDWMHPPPPPLLHLHDSLDSLDSLDKLTSRHGRHRPRAKRRNLHMPDAEENDRSVVDSMDRPTTTVGRRRRSSSAQTTLATTSSISIRGITTADASLLVHDWNVTISSRHCRKNQRRLSNPSS
jgi:hypothetical protein